MVVVWNLIQNSTENDYMDFKIEWYPKSNQGDFDMIHDILSLSNSLSDAPERFIFIGVRDNDKAIFDVSTDPNKRTAEDIVRKLRNYISVPPLIDVVSETRDNKQIDCIKITIQNRNLPYVTHTIMEYQDTKQKKHRIPKYAILSRTCRINDGTVEYAAKEVVEELFARKKGEHLPVLDRFIQYLDDIENWKMVNSENQTTYYYKKNHTFKIMRIENFNANIIYTTKVQNYAYLLDFCICEDYWKYHQNNGPTHDDMFYWIKLELWADNTILETFDIAKIYLKYYFSDIYHDSAFLYEDFYLPNRDDILKLKHRNADITPDIFKRLISKTIQFKICRLIHHLEHENYQECDYDKYLDYINYDDLLNMDYRKRNEKFVFEKNRTQN